jgi:hypothetical protein
MSSIGRWGRPVGPHGIDMPTGSYGHWHPDPRGATAGDPYPKPELFSGDPMTFLMEARSAYKKSEGESGPYSAAVPLYARAILGALEDNARWGIAFDSLTAKEQAWVTYSANLVARSPEFAENYGETLEEWNLILLGIGPDYTPKPYTPPAAIPPPGPPGPTPPPPPPTPVPPPASTLRLLDRFNVTVEFTVAGRTDPAVAVRMTDTTGYFWFFSPNNVELLVKVLDGTAVNDHFWVFIAGLTDVGTKITVVDSTTGKTKTYTGVAGVAFQPVQDTGAF